MAITDSIQANLVSSIIILLQLMFIYSLRHLYELTDTLGILFGCLTSCQQYLRYTLDIHVHYKGGISWNHISK